MTKSRGILAPRKIWSEEQIKLLGYLYPNTYSQTLAKLFRCPLHVLYRTANINGFKKSAWYQASPLAQRLKRGDNVGKAHRYPKGHVPANKGMKGYSNPGSVPTQFKPGTRPPNHKPVGSTRIDSKDGYILMKMAEGQLQWKQIHRVIWQRMHGPIPPGHVVTFIDSNRLNISITNLTSITLKENAYRNSVHKYGPEIAQLYQLKGQITRQINKRERQQNE